MTCWADLCQLRVHIHIYYIYPPLRRTLKALDHGKNATKYGRSIKEGAHPRIVTSRWAGNSKNCPVHSHSAESNVRRTRERGMATYMFEPSIYIAAERSFLSCRLVTLRARTRNVSYRNDLLHLSRPSVRSKRRAAASVGGLPGGQGRQNNRQ